MKWPLRISTETALLIEIFVTLLSLSRQISRRYLNLGRCDLHRHLSQIFIHCYPTFDAVGPYFIWKLFMSLPSAIPPGLWALVWVGYKSNLQSGNCQLSDKIVTVYIIFITSSIVKITASKYGKRLVRYVAGHSFIPHVIHSSFVRLFRLLFCFQKLWGPPSLLHSGYWVVPGGKAAGAWSWPPTLSSAEVKEIKELYLCSTSGPWPVIGWALPLPFYTFCSCSYLSVR